MAASDGPRSRSDSVVAVETVRRARAKAFSSPARRIGAGSSLADFSAARIFLGAARLGFGGTAVVFGRTGGGFAQSALACLGLGRGQAGGTRYGWLRRPQRPTAAIASSRRRTRTLRLRRRRCAGRTSRSAGIAMRHDARALFDHDGARPSRHAGTCADRWTALQGQGLLVGTVVRLVVAVSHKNSSLSKVSWRCNGPTSRPVSPLLHLLPLGSAQHVSHFQSRAPNPIARNRAIRNGAGRRPEVPALPRLYWTPSASRGAFSGRRRRRRSPSAAR